MDFQFVLDEETLMKYLVKYVSKPETRSDAMSDALTALGKQSESNDIDTPAGRNLRSAMIKFLGNRDMGVVEMAHTTLGESLCVSDIKVISVGLQAGARLRINMGRAQHSDVDVNATLNSIMGMYAQRDGPLLEMTFNDFARTYTLSRGQLVPLDTNVVIRFYPDIHIGDNTAESYPHNCRLACIRFIPWIGNISTLLVDVPGTVDEIRWVTKWSSFQRATNFNIKDHDKFCIDADRLREIRRGLEQEVDEHGFDVGIDNTQATTDSNHDLERQVGLLHNGHAVHGSDDISTAGLTDTVINNPLVQWDRQYEIYFPPTGDVDMPTAVAAARLAAKQSVESMKLNENALGSWQDAIPLMNSLQNVRSI